MVATLTHDIAPAQTVDYARGGASFTREFALNRGRVEIAPGEAQPLVSAKASVVTASTGTEAHFWALRSEITVFHAPSGTFLTAVDVVRDLPFDDRDLARLHKDETWSTSKEATSRTLCAKFRSYNEDATCRGELLAKSWADDHVEKNAATEALNRQVQMISADFHRAINQTL